MHYSRIGGKELSNSDRSRPGDNSAHPGKVEDIPAALREGHRAPIISPTDKTQDLPAPKLPIWLIVVGLGTLLGGGIAFRFVTNRNVGQVVAPVPIASTNTGDRGIQATGNNQPPDNSVLNHLPYNEAANKDLVSIGGSYRMRPAAAKKFQAMVEAAKSSGVTITTISAFRSVEDQKRLFFGVGAERGQQPSKRAEVSAPPKYSEHHTGYAVDLGDGSVPATNLNQNFDTTPAYKWLKANAARYSFELSFPKGNIQKVNYEPWHWRFVGDIQSLETFYKAHNLK
jgi:zinc D-Ala-D-Ala carboxypeptidase